MTGYNKDAASIAKNTNTGCAHFETLDSRQLMSASVTGQAVTTPVKIVPISSFVEPQVDSKVTGWKNVSKDPLFAPGGPSMNDVIQGNVNDGWFMAALGSASEGGSAGVIPRDIQQLSNGTYDVTFETGSGKTTVEHVDGLLPINKSGGLEYAKLGKDNCTWVAIVEKALTYYRNQKIPASYSTLSGGKCYEAAVDLGNPGGGALAHRSSAAEDIYFDVKEALKFGEACPGTSAPMAPGRPAGSQPKLLGGWRQVRGRLRRDQSSQSIGQQPQLRREQEGIRRHQQRLHVGQHQLDMARTQRVSGPVAAGHCSTVSIGTRRPAATVAPGDLTWATTTSRGRCATANR